MTNRHWRKPGFRPGPALAFVLAAGFATATAGCGAETIPYPQLSSVKKMTSKLLTREEKDAAIQDLSLEQKRHRSQAEQQLEKR
jgi:hypothetical protein